MVTLALAPEEELNDAIRPVQAGHYRSVDLARADAMTKAAAALQPWIQGGCEGIELTTAKPVRIAIIRRLRYDGARGTAG